LHDVVRKKINRSKVAIDQSKVKTIDRFEK
jgi:hypothetical protein